MEIAVLTGGASAEREVSLATGRAVVEALRERGHTVHAVDTSRGYVPQDEEDRLLAGVPGREPPEESSLEEADRGELSVGVAELPVVREADLAFLALHGGHGEDGHVQAVLEMAGVPYTGTGPLGAAVAMDKRITKELLVQGRVPTPAWAPPDLPPAEGAERLGYPVVVKPASGGSTVGLAVVREPGELEAAVERASRYDDDVLVERFVPGRELTVGLLTGTALPPVEIHPGREVYDYESKYTPGISSYDAPADLSSEERDRLMELGLRAHRLLRQGSYSRVDFRMSPDGEFWCLEGNALPGMTSTSLLPKGAQAAGIDFPELCERIAEVPIRPR